MIELFEQIAARFPDHRAIVDHNEVVTYKQLADLVGALSRDLLERVGAGNCVAFELPSSAQLIGSCLASLSTDATSFAILDPINPADRLRRMRALCAPSLVVSMGRRDQHPVRSNVSPSTRYVCFSSGSTGEPKAALMPSTGLRNVIEEQIDMFEIGPGSNAFWFLSPGFDASLSDVFTAICSGATIHIDNCAHRSTADLVRVLRERDITHVDLPPSLLAYLEPEDLPSLKTVIVGGEVAPRPVVERWAGAAKLVNCYGPTEATICTSMKTLRPQTDPREIGAPISGITYELLQGELHISGPGIALGYAGGAFADRFYERDGKRWFKTGDRVERCDGGFRFLGRIDRQFKIRGMLVSPEEVEAAVVSDSRITECVVEKVGEQLVCFYAGRRSHDLDRVCGVSLPAWMIPTRFEFLPEGVPRVSNGKVERSKLSLAPNDHGVPDENDPAVETFAKLFSQVLAHPVGHDDDFFHVGGDSIMAMEVVASAQDFGIALSTELITAARTPRAVAEKLHTIAAPWTVEEIRDEVSSYAPSIGQGGSPRPAETIFLTGATGFLGRHVLEAFLEEDYRVICLVRARPGEAASDRLREYSDRIEVVGGEMYDANLGIAHATYERLVVDVDTVVHLAADVNLSRPAANLSRSRQMCDAIHRFQHNRRPKRLILASTLSVYVSTDHAFETINETVEPSGRIFGGYATEKIFADTYARVCATLPTAVVRLGLLTGDSKTGRFNEPDVLLSFIRAIDRVGASPRSDHVRFDVTPVDYAARAIAAIAGEGANVRQKKSVYHIANPSSVSLTELVDVLQIVGARTISECAPDEFRKSLLGVLDRDVALAYLAASRLYGEPSFASLRNIDLFLATGVDLNAPSTDTWLAERGVRRDVGNRELLERYVRFALGRT